MAWQVALCPGGKRVCCVERGHREDPCSWWLVAKTRQLQRLLFRNTPPPSCFLDVGPTQHGPSFRERHEGAGLGRGPGSPGRNGINQPVAEGAATWSGGKRGPRSGLGTWPVAWVVVHGTVSLGLGALVFA